MVEITKGNLQTFTLLGFVILAIIFILPFITPLLFAAVLAYAFYPLYKRISLKVNKHITALAVCIALVAGLGVVANYGFVFIINELASIFFFLANLPSRIELSPALTDIFRMLTTQTIAFLSEQAKSIPDFIVSFFLFFVALFYFLISGREIFDALLQIIPLSENKRETLIKDIKSNVDAFVYVTIAIGVLQGIVAAIGFTAFGLHYPILAGVTAGVLSIIPVLGPYLLYLTVALFLLYSSGTTMAVGLLIYGIAVGSLLDYVARPYLMGKKAKSHPLVIFLGIFGGIKVLGILGIIVGPIVLAVTVTFIKDIHLYGLK